MFEATWNDGDVIAVVGDSPRALEELVARQTGADPATVSIDHLCANCGGTDHGVPSVAKPVFVSRSRSCGLTAGVVSARTAVGIDIESLQRVERMPIESVLLHPAEDWATTSRDLARLWTAKEAILKLAGVGLTVEPSDLLVEPIHGKLELVQCPERLDLLYQPELIEFTVTEDIIGTIALAR